MTYVTYFSFISDQNNDDEESDYVKNVVLTPTKFKKGRDCGVQCEPEKETKRYTNLFFMKWKTNFIVLFQFGSKNEKETTSTTSESQRKRTFLVFRETAMGKA